MRASVIPRPGVVLGQYPEHTKFETDSMRLAFENVIDATKRRLKLGTATPKLETVVDMVNRYQAQLEKMSEAVMTVHIQRLRSKLVCHGLEDEIVALSFATIREVSKRTLGMHHFDVQLFGGWVMVRGMVAEMETGEGKTLTSTLASCTAALAGIPVHVITANDYLASRDASTLSPLYHRLGLTVATVIEDMDSEQRQRSYQANIVHTTNKQIAFDYLRDRLAIGQDRGELRFQFRQIYHQNKGQQPLLLRGLCFAIIDEVDNVLVDEARTPLILAQQQFQPEQQQLYSQALRFAETLVQERDFRLDDYHRQVSFTKRGRQHLSQLTESLAGIWANSRRRQFIVGQAMSAKYLYIRDKHYLISEGTIQIIDENSGRTMADRSWEQGLHQLIELKEGCEMTAQKETLGRMSYQRFFRRYLHLSGMSGTVTEVAKELASIYRLRVVKIPTHRISKRLKLGNRIYRTTEQKYASLIDRVRQLNQVGRPLLIGTRSVAESETISHLLSEHGFDHRVLNARQDQEEADIISQAGQLGKITVATNMAGRGTDIKLGKKVAELGGLHVISVQQNDARRIDRQLFGRCARQGEPGSAESILSIKDENLALFYSDAMLKLLTCFGKRGAMIPMLTQQIVLALPQLRIERQHRQLRTRLQQMDDQIYRMLGFSGPLE